MKRQQTGFTLIDLMITVSVIGILAAVAIPNYSIYIYRAKISEGINTAPYFGKLIAEFYAHNGYFPRDNASLGLPDPQALSSHYLQQIEIENGAIHLSYKTDEINSKLTQAILSFRPAIVANAANSVIVWQCAYNTPPTGLTAYGQNKTSLPAEYLPLVCQPQ